MGLEICICDWLCTVSEDELLKLSVCYGCVMVVFCLVVCTVSEDDRVCCVGVMYCAVYC